MLQISTWQWIVAIAAMALLTYSTRATPFLFIKKSKLLGRMGSGKFAVLGPALLASTTVVILYSETTQAIAKQQLIPYVVAVVTVWIALKLSKNIGLAMLISLLVYGLGLNLGS